MNLLPPRPWAKRFFGLWLSLILLFFGSSVAGTFLIQDLLIKKVDVLESDVHIKRRSLYEARKKEKNEMEFMKKHSPVFDYRETVNLLEERRINWYQIVEVLEQRLPAQTEILQWKVVGDKIVGWGYFDSSQVATEYVSKLVQNNPHLLQRGWVDCIGESCLPENEHKSNTTGGILIQFQFEIKQINKKSPEGGDSPFENRLPENVGNPV